MAVQNWKLYKSLKVPGVVAMLPLHDYYTLKSLIAAIMLEIICKGSEFFTLRFIENHKLAYIICNLMASIGTWVSFTFIYLLINSFSSAEDQKDNKFVSIVRISLCWFCALPWGILPFFGYGVFIKSGNGAFCGPAWASENLYDQVYFILMYALGFVIPLVYCAIINWMKGSNKNEKPGYKSFHSLPQTLLLEVIFYVVVLWIPYGLWGFVKMIWGNINEPIDFVVLIIAHFCYVITPNKLSTHLEKMCSF
ncbi:uncharacterized protein LOC105845815 [Hydra vulgaris]|uniref:Uncharacterized protein LOC105845815 n=1 Tax=Hydra vulgaris TaxID=6087 RepID=A0ABM4CAF4_HYDVU